MFRKTVHLIIIFLRIFLKITILTLYDMKNAELKQKMNHLI